MSARGERGPGGNSARQGEAERGDRGGARGAVSGLEPVHAGSDQVAQPAAEGSRVNGQRQAERRRQLELRLREEFGNVL